MIEPGIDESRQQRLGNADPRCDEVGVKSGLRRRARQLDDVAPRGGFPSGEVNMQRPEIGRFPEHSRPNRRVDLIGGSLERERVRAMRARQGTAMRQFDEEANGRRWRLGGQGVQISNTLFVIRSFNIETTSDWIFASGAE